MLNILGPNDPALNALRQSLDAHPEWDATLRIIPWADYRATLMSVLAAETAPYQAVAVPGHLWLPELADAGYLAAIDALANHVPAEVLTAYHVDDILPSVARECRFNGRQWMLPLFSDGHILFYRQDLVDIQDNETVPLISPLEMRTLAQKAHHPPEVYGLALKAHPSEIFLDWLPYLWAAGGEILDDGGEPAFAGEAGVAALEYYCSLREFAPPETHTFGNHEIAKVIKQGAAALVTTWGGQAAAIVLAEDNVVAQRYRYATFPRPWNATWGIALPNHQPRDTQLEMLTLLLRATGREQDRRVIQIAGSPVRWASYAPAELARYPWLAAQLEMLRRADTLPISPQTGSYLGALYEAVYAAFTGETPPAAALRAAAASVRASLAGKL